MLVCARMCLQDYPPLTLVRFQKFIAHSKAAEMLGAGEDFRLTQIRGCQLMRG